MKPVITTVIVTCMLLGACVSAPPRETPPKLAETVPLSAASDSSAAWPTNDWWKRYADPQLDQLMQRALTQAPTLDLARTRLEQALRAVDMQRAASGASLGASAGVDRQRLSDNGLIPPEFVGFHWYSQADLGVQLHYDIDFWGRHRAAIQAATDQARAAAAEQAAVRLTLLGGVADTYFGWQTLATRRQFSERGTMIAQRLRDIAAARVEHGVDNATTLDDAEARLADAREQALQLDTALHLQRLALASLIGVSDDDLGSLEVRPLPHPETTLPASIAIDLVARRPDITASRWRVEAALHGREAARAAFYPDVSLGALFGLSSIELDKLFNAGSRIIDVGPALHLPLFDAGRLRARYGAANAELDSAVADYHATIVAAAHDAASHALQLQRSRERRLERQRQLDAVAASVARVEARAASGLSDARLGLLAEAALLDQRDALTILDGAAVSADIALLQALGGGYRAEDLPPADATAKATTP